MTESEIKSWQHGYDIDYLKDLEKKYQHYNSFALSPFVQFKKNNIAESLHKNQLFKVDDDSFYTLKTSKVKSKITMHGDTVVGFKRPGDLTIGNITGNLERVWVDIEDRIEGSITTKNTWFYIWAEDKEIFNFLMDKGCSYIGPKITTFGEIYSIFYKGDTPVPVDVPMTEYASIVKLADVDKSIIDSIANRLENLPEFTNHYSNYNKGKSWSALSLRGYSPDPSFITKPIEMSKKWKEEHKDENFFLQNTSLCDTFKEDVERLLEPFGENIHRVRFMQLKPGGGELERHTDQVDPDSGGSIGKLARIHFPIVTNPGVIFTVWDYLGKKQEVHMKAGECWFLDTRKAHRAINGGTENRIHLVVDLITETKLAKKILENM